MKYDIAIIGGGPAGLMAAQACGYGGKKVLLLEKNERVGKKLLASGSGQCNITNQIPMEQFIEQFHEKTRFVRRALHGFGPDQLIETFETWGVPMEFTPGGKVFPASRKASDVLGALTHQIQKAGVTLRLNEGVLGVQRDAQGFLITTDKGSYTSKKLLIACGGRSYPALGTSGDGYGLARSLGHTIVPPRPALAPVHIAQSPLADLSGVTLKDAWITHWRKGRKLKAYEGDLLITHTGLSGPVILNHSRNFDPTDELRINFVKFSNEEAFAKGLGDLIQSNGKYMIRTALDIYDVPRRLMELILRLADIAPETKCAEVTKVQRTALGKMLSAFPLTIDEVGPYEVAMATAGGVSTDEIHSDTMCSRLVPGLYFAGEVMDVDGMTGGYNIQFAFSSAMAAVKGLLKDA